MHQRIYRFFMADQPVLSRCRSGIENVTGLREVVVEVDQQVTPAGHPKMQCVKFSSFEQNDVALSKTCPMQHACVHCPILLGHHLI